MQSWYNKRRVFRFFGVLFLCSLTFSLWLGNVSWTSWQVEMGKVSNAQNSAPAKLVKIGIERYEAGDFKSSIEHLEKALNIYQGSKSRDNEARVLEYLGRAYQEIGQSEKAISHWDKAIAYYRQVQNRLQLGRMLTEQAQAYYNIGHSRKAIALLCHKLEPEANPNCLAESALQIARQQNDLLGEVAALGSLGEAYRLVGRYDEAITWLESAEKIAPKGYDFLVLNSLGNAYVSQAQRENLRAQSVQQSGILENSEFADRAKQDYEQARKHFQNSFKKADEQGNQPAQMRALLNLIQLYYSTKNLADEVQFGAAVEDALVLLEKSPDSVNKVYASVDLANLPIITSDVTSPLTQCPKKRQLPDEKAVSLLKGAVKIAKNLPNSRAESFANGALGHFYECHQEYKQALESTRQAQQKAVSDLNAKDSLYLWEWQVGRIFKAQGQKLEEIMNAYQGAYNTLEQLRKDILVTERDLQFDFRDTIKPIYRELAQLNLKAALATSSDSDSSSIKLTHVLEIIDSLRIAELQNFFGNKCVSAAINNYNKNSNNSSEKFNEFLGKNTAVFSSIIFEDTTAIVLSLPNGDKQIKNRVHLIHEKSESLREKIKTFREELVNTLGSDFNRTQAQILYELIIRPFEKNLTAKIQNLVFVQDDFLRNIPMAALYDEKEGKYLVEKYALATTPSLSITASKTLKGQNSRALILGLTEEATVDRQPHPLLSYVTSEIDAVKGRLPKSKLLENKHFTSENLKKELDKNIYSVLHIATHAQFGTVPEDTFLVAGNNSKLTISELENILRDTSAGSKVIDLLALTACETALGDDRAILGLAGVALQVGVKSSLASLWPVGDESTSNLVSEFYQHLSKSGVSKAEALRQAQLKLIETKKHDDINDQYDHPYYWASFILIGNGL